MPLTFKGVLPVLVSVTVCGGQIVPAIIVEVTRGQSQRSRAGVKVNSAFECPVPIAQQYRNYVGIATGYGHVELAIAVEVRQVRPLCRSYGVIHVLLEGSVAVTE